MLHSEYFLSNKDICHCVEIENNNNNTLCCPRTEGTIDILPSLLAYSFLILV